MCRCTGVGGQLQDLSVLNLSTPAAVQFISTVASSAFQTLSSATQNRKPKWPRDPNSTSASAY